eukprot:NODE_4119_length_708_cov_331.520674.p1 GENE.NODE_4119_length_708_cov_331.520674~~NODE_4119_length_708_cov_331.520674.p1  ORF type:complete len:200 (+),score=47.42 NODE_4119_length_708_cov_331.520674:35-601(+)
MVGLGFWRTVELQEATMAFDHDRGACVLMLEDYPPGHELWTTYPPPPKRTVPGVVQCYTVAFPQAHTLAIAYTSCIQANVAVPDWLVKLLCVWCFPEMVRRMLKAGGGAAQEGGPHYDLIRNDRTGLYAECERLTATGTAMEQDGNHPTYTSRTMPPPSAVTDRPHGIVAFEATRSAWEKHEKSSAEI